MTREGSKAAEIAAQHVEAIVAAAEKSAEEIRWKAREEADQEIAKGREEAARLAEQARQQLQERMASGQEAADQVLEEAKVLSSGLRQLGASLQSQGERILRDVQAAHRRMQSELRVSSDELPARRPRMTERSAEPTDDSSNATPEERAALERAARELRASESRARRRRGNPFDELDVPNWVDR